MLLTKKLELPENELLSQRFFKPFPNTRPLAIKSLNVFCKGPLPYKIFPISIPK